MEIVFLVLEIVCEFILTI